MRRRLLGGVVWLATIASLSACGGTGSGPTAWQQAVVTLQRTPCRGTCPAYVVTVQGDGTVFYKGVQHAPFIGTRQGKVAAADVQRLVAAFDAADFWELHDSYTGGAPDQSSAVTTLVAGTRHKTINDYGGATAAPPALRALESRIDMLVDTAQWDR